MKMIIEDLDTCLSDIKVRDLLDGALEGFRRNLHYSEELAISGAMRWPIGLRPEVMVYNHTYFN